MAKKISVKRYAGIYITESTVKKWRERRGEEIEAKKTIPGYRARRWVVEVCHSWFNRFRKLLVRYEKTHSSHLALLHLAAAIICWRKVGVIYG
jgi:putative transposase